jgi:hypothetical protein
MNYSLYLMFLVKKLGIFSDTHVELTDKLIERRSPARQSSKISVVICKVEMRIVMKILWVKPLLIISALSLLWSATGCNSENTTKLIVTTTPTQTQTTTPTVTSILRDRVVLAEVFTKEK